MHGVVLNFSADPVGIHFPSSTTSAFQTILCSSVVPGPNRGYKWETILSQITHNTYIASLSITESCT